MRLAPSTVEAMVGHPYKILQTQLLSLVLRPLPPRTPVKAAIAEFDVHVIAASVCIAVNRTPENSQKCRKQRTAKQLRRQTWSDLQVIFDWGFVPHPSPILMHNFL